MIAKTSDKSSLILAVLWTLLAGFLILSPGSVVAPLQAFNFFEGTDKVVHFSLFLGFTGLWTLALRGSPYAVIFLLLLAVFLAGFTEYLQGFVDGRTPDTKDAIADSAGAIVGVFLALRHAKNRRFRRQYK